MRCLVSFIKNLQQNILGFKPFVQQNGLYGEKIILDNWLPLQKLWQESLPGGGLQPELCGRIIGVQTQMETFEYYLGVTIMQKVLGHSDTCQGQFSSLI